MEDQELAALRGPLSRMQDEDLSRRDRDVARRLVLRWLHQRGMDLREHEGLYAVGRWDEPTNRLGHFHPEFEVWEDGTVEPWPDDHGRPSPDDVMDDEEERRMPDEEREALRRRIEAHVEEARGQADEPVRLKDLLGRLDDPTWIHSRHWEDQAEIFAPLFTRFRESDASFAVECAADWSPDSEGASFLLELLDKAAAGEPLWGVPDNLQEFLLGCRRGDRAEGDWERTVRLYARTGPRGDTSLRRILLRPGSSPDDIHWAASVLEARTDAVARSLAEEAISAWRIRGRFDLVDALTGALADHGTAGDVSPLMDLAREGVALRYDMLETWSHAMRLRAKDTPDPMKEKLRSVGVNPSQLWDAATLLGLVGPGGHLHRATGALQFHLPNRDGAAAGHALDGLRDDWWRVPALKMEDFRVWLEGFAGTLEPALTQAVRSAIESPFALRAAADALLGHPDEWIRFQEERRNIEQAFFKKVAHQVLEIRMTAPTAHPRVP